MGAGILESKGIAWCYHVWWLRSMRNYNILVQTGWNSWSISVISPPEVLARELTEWGWGVKLGSIIQWVKQNWKPGKGLKTDDRELETTFYKLYPFLRGQSLHKWANHLSSGQSSHSNFQSWKTGLCSSTFQKLRARQAVSCNSKLYSCTKFSIQLQIISTSTFFGQNYRNLPGGEKV